MLTNAIGLIHHLIVIMDKCSATLMYNLLATEKYVMICHPIKSATMETFP
jgi:hypothetical protein